MSTLTKKILWLMPVLMLLASFSFSQDAVKERKYSNVEAFASQDGILLKKEFFEVGSFHKCKIEVVVFTDLMRLTKSLGLHFSLDVTKSYSTDTKSAFLDPDELDALSKSIQILMDKVVTTSPTNYTEVQYCSRDGFQAGCYWSDNAWTGFIKLEKYDSDSFLWFKADELKTLNLNIQQAKDIIATK